MSFFLRNFAGFMRIHRLYKLFLLLLVTGGGLLTGCRPDTICRQDTDVAMGVSVRWLQKDSAGTTAEQNTFDSIRVQGIGNDSVLYNNGKNLSALRLPMRPDTCVTAFALLWHGTKDTLFIRHDNTRHFVSQACGCMVYHTIDTVWHSGSAIDSIALINSTIENNEQENIQLTMCNL